MEQCLTSFPTQVQDGFHRRHIRLGAGPVCVKESEIAEVSPIEIFQSSYSLAMVNHPKHHISMLVSWGGGVHSNRVLPYFAGTKFSDFATIVLSVL